MKSLLAFVFCLFVATSFACDPPSYRMMCGSAEMYQTQPAYQYNQNYSPSITPSSQTPSNQLPPVRQQDMGEIVPMLETTSTNNKIQWIAVKANDGRMYRAAVVNGYMPAIDTNKMTSHYKYKIPFNQGYQQEVAQFGYLSYKKSTPELVAHYKKLSTPNMGPEYFVSK